MKIKNTMLKECAITVIIEWGELKSPGNVVMLNYMLMDTVKIATLIYTIM